MSKTEAGHTFLAKMGKKRLRPGGITATNWLIEHAQLTSDTKILEVACNMGTTSIELASKYHCKITGIDLDTKALEKAHQNIAKHKLEDYITVQQANAMALPFPDESFDVVINEAMLTMLGNKQKQMAISEYHRVLKKGGVLLTHDVMLCKEEMNEIINELRETIQVKVTPLTQEGWNQMFLEQGFAKVEMLNGKMSLLNPIGMIRDEGLLGTLRIIKNGLKKENRSRFRQMFQFFNHPELELQYIAVCSRKRDN